ncbi:helix-turn-helix domain-containing protein [Nocardiopsis aegyptia]|uniref:helix-turn-helix domain-containing protein n=1 Tax=Nocardiopsis aegyptia TaxID=220378 RepID=UPI0015CCB606|nr:helix-turn-helix transcriptional regulator [Nocardiopsis aegyptia]
MTQRFPQHLTKLRVLSGLSQRQLASRARVSPSACCRWEKGEVVPRRGHVENLDRVLNAEGRLIKTWQRDTTDGSLPSFMQDAGLLQAEAITIDFVSPVLVSGLAQCPSYARIVFREANPTLPGAAIERLVTARCARLAYLRKRNNPMVTAVFPESALTWPPEAVRREQAEHLLALMDDERMRIHLVPSGSVLVGVTSPLFLVKLVDGGRAASSDHVSGNVIIEDSEDFERLSELVKRALGASLPEGQSRKVLEDLL